jgi:hypothetical protein
MKEIILNSDISFGRILAYFHAEKKESDLYSVSYHVNGYDLIFFRNTENEKLECFCLQTLAVLTIYEIVYLLASSHEGESIVAVIKGIGEADDYENFQEITSSASLKHITANSLKLRFLSQDIYVPESVNRNLLFSIVFEKKFLIRNNRIVFPLVNDSRIVNLKFLDDETELNSNPGNFSSNLLPSCRSIVLFFSGHELLKHAHEKVASDYFYILFSRNFNIAVVHKLILFSAEKNLPVNVFLPKKRSEVMPLFGFIQLLLSLYNKPFDSVFLELSETSYRLNFFVRNDNSYILPLVDFIALLNRRLIILYNGEMAIVNEDISLHLNLIKTETAKGENYMSSSISFAANNKSLCVVLTEIFSILKINFISFGVY